MSGLAGASLLCGFKGSGDVERDGEDDDDGADDFGRAGDWGQKSAGDPDGAAGQKRVHPSPSRSLLVRRQRIGASFTSDANGGSGQQIGRVEAECAYTQVGGRFERRAAHSRPQAEADKQESDCSKDCSYEPQQDHFWSIGIRAAALSGRSDVRRLRQ